MRTAEIMKKTVTASCKYVFLAWTCRCQSACVGSPQSAPSLPLIRLLTYQSCLFHQLSFACRSRLADPLGQGSRSLHPPDLLGSPVAATGRRGHAAVGERLGQFVQGARAGAARRLQVGQHVGSPGPGLCALGRRGCACVLWRARAELRVAKPGPLAFAAANAARVRCEISPASSSATAAICVSRNLPTGPGGTLGRSQNTTPASPVPSTTCSRKRAFLASRSSLAITSAALRARQAASAAASCGRSFLLPLSTSSNSAATTPPAPATYLATAARWASRPRPERPCRSVLTR